MDKKISVIVPVYNTEKYLKQTLDSIRFQTCKHLEIICVLDCPTDNSAKIVERIATEDNRIRPVYNTRNMGLLSALDTGLENSGGEYIHFMDSCDFISSDFYKNMIDAITAADADVAVCSVFFEVTPERSIWFRETGILSGREKFKKTEVINWGWAWRYLIKKGFWVGNNFSFHDLAPIEDKSVMIPVIYHANKVAVCPDAVYFYKNRENSIMNNIICNTRLNENRKENTIKAHKFYKNFMRVHGISEENKLYRIINSLAGMTVCINEPIEYGKMGEKISVIIPIYNAEEYLKQTLDSVRFQTYNNLEIVCVLDCPTDNSTEIVEKIATEDMRIKIVYNPQNMGLPATRNIGVENASGEYIHFMDSDDLISPDFYEILISAAVKADTDVAACSVFYEKKAWRSIWFRESKVLSGPSKIKGTEVAILGWSWRYLIRKSFWNSHNFSFPELVPMEDMPVMIPMIYYANKVVLCPNAVYFYKYRENSILNKDSDPVRKKRDSNNRRKARKIFKNFMRAHKIKRTNRLLDLIKRKFFNRLLHSIKRKLL
jgi:glycosyltransferase involved in cell wall biosynthesis